MESNTIKILSIRRYYYIKCCHAFKIAAIELKLAYHILRTLTKKIIKSSHSQIFALNGTKLPLKTLENIFGVNIIFFKF